MNGGGMNEENIPTKQEKEQAAKEHAIYIIGCVEYLANNK